MENRKSKRSLRLALVLGAAVAGTALVGWGGLAAWQAYTQNSGNAFTSGSISHTNSVKGVSCNSTTTESAAATNCSMIVGAQGMGSTWPGATGSVTITTTGSLTSTFALSSPPADAPTGLLCADLSLTVTGADGATYVSQSGIGPISLTALKDSANSATWGATGDSNIFTFSVAPNTGYASSSAMGQTCSFDVLFTQGG